MGGCTLEEGTVVTGLGKKHCSAPAVDQQRKFLDQAALALREIPDMNGTTKPDQIRSAMVSCLSGCSGKPREPAPDPSPTMQKSPSV